MPRYSLKLRPWKRIISPGLSSVPANRLPIITALAPTAMRLGDVAGVADAAVGDHRHLVRRGRARALGDRGDHRHADAGDDPGRADRAGADADLDRVDPEIDQRLGGFAGGDVAGDEVDIRELAADPADHVEHALRVAVRGVDDEDVDVGGDQRLGPLQGLACRRRWRRRSAGVRASPCTRSDT